MGKTGRGGNSRMDMGVVMSWSVGLAGIALLLLIMLILFGNLQGNVGFGTQGTTITVNNESPTWLNSSNYTFAVSNASTGSYAIVNAWNLSGAQLVPSGYYQIDGDVVFTNGSNYPATLTSNETNFTYTYVYTTDTIGKQNTDNFINNYTKSVTNTSEQFPTVGTIIGVALLLFILIALLVFALSRMTRLGRGAGTGGNFG